MSLLENDSGDDGEVRHKRFDYPAPSLAGIIDFFVTTETGLTDVQTGILLNQTPQEVHQLKKQVRFCLRAPCAWATSQGLIDSDGTTLCLKDEQPPGWMMPAGRQGELFRHLVVSSITKQYPNLFMESDLATQIKEVQLNNYGRFAHTPFVIRREVLTRLIESCAQDMRTHPCLRDVETESQHISPPPKLKRCRLEGIEFGEASEMPDPKRRMTHPLGFATVKTIATPPPAIFNVTKSEPVVTPTKKSVVDHVKSFNPSSDSHRSMSTLSELLEEERAVMDKTQMNQPAASPASIGTTPRRIIDNSSNSSTSSATSDDRSAADVMRYRKSLTARVTAESQASPRSGRFREHDRAPYPDERASTAVAEGRRLRIGNIPEGTKKYHVDDFFGGFNAGVISISEKPGGKNFAFADFTTRDQAKRALKALDRKPLRGVLVDIDIANPTKRVEKKCKHSAPTNAPNGPSSFLRDSRKVEVDPNLG
ncbi:hypothetical protein E4T39_04693 [Aureobasidium subglaciale]|nr:hypothetical protein E4T39_04693 [Aureobasidium subglaciale]